MWPAPQVKQLAARFTYFLWRTIRGRGWPSGKIVGSFRWHMTQASDQLVQVAIHLEQAGGKAKTRSLRRRLRAERLQVMVVLDTVERWAPVRRPDPRVKSAPAEGGATT